MDDHERAEQMEKRFLGGLTALIVGSFVAIAYLVDRASRRWWQRNEPFAEVREGLRRARTRVRATRADVDDIVGLFTDAISMR